MVCKTQSECSVERIHHLVMGFAPLFFLLFDDLEEKIVKAENTEQWIGIIEKFLLERLNDEKTINRIVKNTVDSLLYTNGSVSIKSILKDDLSRRRQLEKNFKKQIGIINKPMRIQSSDKQLNVHEYKPKK